MIIVCYESDKISQIECKLINNPNSLHNEHHRSESMFQHTVFIDNKFRNSVVNSPETVLWYANYAARKSENCASELLEITPTVGRNA